MIHTTARISPAVRYVKLFGVGLCTLLTLMIAGCGPPPLMLTPNLYANGDQQLFVNVPPERQVNTVDVFYATDRLPEATTDGTLEYGVERSPTLSFGSCVVELGNDLPWDELVRDTAAAKRAKDIPIKISSITQLGQFPPTPYPIVRDEKRGFTQTRR